MGYNELYTKIDHSWLIYENMGTMAPKRGLD